MFLLPVISFLLFFLINYVYRNKVIDAVTNSWLFITLYTWITVEAFSVFKVLNQITVLIVWFIACAALAAVCIRGKLWSRLIVQLKSENGLLNKYQEYKGHFIFSFMFIAFVSVIALLRSQNLIDNLTHRLPKIMHWIQNRTVASFATSSPRQVQLSSLTEYMNAQIYLLGGNDRLINMVQIGAYVCSALLIFGISRKMGVAYRLSIAASWLYLLIPAVIIEVCTVQTDVTAGVFLLMFVYFLLDYIHIQKLQMDRAGCLSCIRLASCVMLGYLSKPTVCFTMLIFFIWMCGVRIYRRDNVFVLLKYTLAGGVTALILFSPSYIRNYQTYKVNEYSENVEETKNEETTAVNVNIESTQVSPPGPTPAREPNQAMVARNLVSPKAFIMSCLKNLGTNASSRCFPKINEFITRVVNKCDSLLNYAYSEFIIFVDQGSLGETNEPSPCIMWFCLAAWILVIFRISKISKEQFIYLLCATLGLIIQSGLMGYTYYRVRYLMGVMAVLCPAFMMVVQNIKRDESFKGNIAAAMVAVSGLGAVNALTYEWSYMIDGFKGEKVHQYFVNNKGPEFYYDQMSRFANENGYTQVGIDGTIQYEYALWQTIDNLERLEMVNVDDTALGKYEDRDYVPECIFKESMDVEIEMDDILECHNVEYRCVWVEFGNNRYYSVFLPVDMK